MANDRKNLECAQSLLQAAEGELNVAAYQPRIVFPGDDISGLISKSSNRSTENLKAAKIGPGLHIRLTQSAGTAEKSEMNIAVDTVGVLRHRAPCHYWVETSKKRYTPHMGDQVVGIIEDRGGDFYTVNISSGSHCIMNRLAFEGATKRNKPELKRGDVVYARVVHAVNSGSDIELSCTSGAGGSKKEWTTGETVYGELPQGLLIHLPLDQARALLLPDCVVLNALSRHFTFEVAVGMNGIVWLRSSSPGTNSFVDAIVIRNAILNAELLNAAQTEAMVDQLAALSKRVSR